MESISIFNLSGIKTALKIKKSRSSYRKTTFLFVDPTGRFSNHFISDLRLIDDLVKKMN